MQRLTQQEEELMLIAWEIKEGVVKDFIAKMKNQTMPYTTVSSMIKKLETKGFLTSKLYGNTYVYRPKISVEKYKNSFLTNVVQNYFENSYKELVNFFAQKNKISAEELKEIISIIENEK